MTKEIKTKMDEEIKKFTEQFESQYGHTSERTAFFAVELPKFAQKVFEKNIDLNKELRGFIDEYKKEELGGYNATYGNLYHWLIAFAAVLLEVDAFELSSSVVYK